jgi:hypothetical protein
LSKAKQLTFAQVVAAQRGEKRIQFLYIKMGPKCGKTMHKVLIRERRRQSISFAECQYQGSPVMLANGPLMAGAATQIGKGQGMFGRGSTLLPSLQRLRRTQSPI